MAKISRLKLAGVRSFGPDEIQDIPFEHPVTLILGDNGCGKTTIIEALKFACTGSTPSGSSNKSNFIFNPQLKCSSKTKAVVKMKLIDSKGEQLLVNRAMRAEQTTPERQSFVTADATFSIIDKYGVERTMSTRCADLSKLICDRLGVSESILNNVIFCHQDNSLWPLDDGSKVKEKFDHIFDSTKYDKSIKYINAIIRNGRAQLTQIKEQINARRDKKNFVEKKRADLHKNENNLLNIESDIAKKEEAVIPIQQKLNEICKKEDSFTALMQELSSKETENENLQQNQKELRKKLKEEFKGTDEELKEEIKGFEKQLRNLPSIEQINTNIEKCNASIRKSQAKIGQLNAEREQYNRIIQDRNTNIDNLGQALKLDLNISSDGKLLADNTIHTLKTALTKLKNSIDELQDKFTNDENLLQKGIDNTRENVAKINQKIASNNSQIKQNGQKVRDITLQLNRLGNSGEELKQLNNKIDKFDNDLRKLSGSFDTEATEELIKINKQDINKMEDELTRLEKDYKILQNNFELENNIETRSKDIREKENNVFELKNVHYDEFKILFDDIPENNVKTEVENILRVNRKIVNDFQKKIEDKKGEATNHEATIKFKKEELSSLEDELETSLSKITNLTKGQPYEEFYKTIEKQLEFYQTSKGQLESAKIMYEKFLQTFKSSKPCCPVCDTDFKENRSAIAKIVNKIEGVINNIPTQLTEADNNLKKAQELFNRLQQTKPIYDRSKSLQQTLIPDLNTKLSILSQESTLNKSEKDILVLKSEKPQKIVEVATKVISDATLIDKYQAEIAAYRKEIENLQEQMVTIESEKSREEVEAEMTVCKLNISQKRQIDESNQKKLLEFRCQCQDLKERRNKLFDKQLQLEKSMHGKPQLLEQEKELKGQIASLLEDIKSLEMELEPTKEKLSELTNDLEKIKTSNRSEISKKYEAHNKLNATFQKITEAQYDVENFERRCIDKEFEEQMSKQEQYNKELSILNSKRDMVKNSSIKQRELQDNLDIRSKEIKIKKVLENIATLKAQVKDYDHTSLLKEKHLTEAKYTSIVKETCTLHGKKEQLEKIIEDERKDLDRPEYKEAYTLYCNKYFELKIKERKLKELQIYSKGLENAIIEFHKEKMMNINSLIREYWRSIYRGNDIDYIQIKTEQPRESSALSLRRTYNYKVIQIKNDTEIEMKGCCSAGQKVLACLIIRMALSTVFSHNCGILALDEPTTNLDRENILSLSDTLAKLIQDRRVEKNFQLLVITHDEDFIRSLSQTGKIDTCLRVTRNRNGMSVVKKQNVP